MRELLNIILNKIFGVRPYKKPTYAGYTFGVLKEKFMPTINFAYEKISDLPDDIQCEIIGSGIDGEGPFMTINNKAKSTTKKTLTNRLKDIEHLQIKFSDIPKFL